MEHICYFLKKSYHIKDKLLQVSLLVKKLQIRVHFNFPQAGGDLPTGQVGTRL
jgi:hypothetical protein